MTSIQAKKSHRRAFAAGGLIVIAAAFLVLQLSSTGMHAADAGKPLSSTKKVISASGVRAPKQTHRLVSLAPSNTELIYSLGAEADLVGVSTFCTFPAQAAKKPKMGSFISVKLETLAKTKPELVVLVSGQEPLKANLEKHGYHVRLFPNSSLADISANIRQLGELCGKEAKAQALASDLDADIASLRQIVGASKARKVFYCIWPKPLMTVGGGSFLDDVISTCGGSSIASGIKTSYPKLGFERLIATDPDIIILPFESHGSIDLKSKPWASLKAIKNGRYYYLPDRAEDYLSRPTLMIRKGLYWLATKIHPERQKELDQWLKGRKPVE